VKESAPRRPLRRWHTPERSAPAFGLSLLAHAVLFIAIAFMVRWKTEPAGTVVAELWGAMPAPTVEPAPAPPPPPVVKPAPVEPPPEPRKADIVEQKAPEPVKKIEPEKKVEPPKKAEPDPRIEQQKREAEEKREAEQKQKREAELKAVKAEQAAAAKIREAAMQRALAAAGPPTGPPGGSPTAGGAGVGRGYESQVVSCIRPHIVYSVPDGLRPKQHVAEFEVQLLPSGEQVGVPRLLAPSGLAAYDQAVERAIRRCDPFPRPREGAMPRSLRLTFDPVETR
jgi:colicin import membrane protein